MTTPVRPQSAPYADGAPATPIAPSAEAKPPTLHDVANARLQLTARALGVDEEDRRVRAAMFRQAFALVEAARIVLDAHPDAPAATALDEADRALEGAMSIAATLQLDALGVAILTARDHVACQREYARAALARAAASPAL